MRGISFILNKSEHSILASILDGIDITSLY